MTPPSNSTILRLLNQQIQSLSCWITLQVRVLFNVNYKIIENLFFRMLSSSFYRKRKLFLPVKLSQYNIPRDIRRCLLDGGDLGSIVHALREVK